MTKIIYETHATGHWKELFASKNKILGGHNLSPGEEICATIHSVGTDTVYDKETKGNKDLVVLHFQGGKIPPMALNVTNAETISMLYGPNYTAWQGKQILIHTAKVKAFGKEHDALRVRAKVPRDDDFSGFEKAMRECKDLNQLKDVFMGMPKHAQGALSKLKDEIKGQLS